MDYGNTVRSDAPMHPEAKIIPLKEPIPMSDFNPEDANAVSRFFQSIADKVVLASTLAKEVEDLRQEVAALKRDVESYRENTARLDEEVTRLRQERITLQDDNAVLHRMLDQETLSHDATKKSLADTTFDRDRWHGNYIAIAQEIDNLKRERDTAQLRVLELEDQQAVMKEQILGWQKQATDAADKLSSIRMALAA